MRKHTKWITAVAAFGLTATIAFAGTGVGQGQHHGFGRHGHAMMAHLAKKLNLTDAQKAQWKDIRKSSHEQNAAFFQQARQTRQDFRAAKDAGDQAKIDALKPAMKANREQFKQIRAANEQQLMSILTDQQRTQYQTLKAERAARHAQREAGQSQK